MVHKLYAVVYYSKVHHSRTLYKIIRNLCIYLIKFLFPIVSNFYNYKNCGKTSLTDKEIIISLTSYSVRLNKVHLTIKTLLRQSHRVDNVILWISNEEYKTIDQLPKSLLKLQKYGLELKLCADLKSHKKYYYAMLENPESIVVTVDDDMYYPENLIEELIKGHLKYPQSICCLRGHYIKMNEKGNIANYDQWHMEYQGEIQESMFICPTGCQGVLYPPKSLNQEAFEMDKIQELCPKADDLWLKFMSVKNYCSAVIIKKEVIPFAEIRGSQAVTLSMDNNGNKENDIQLKALLKEYPEFTKILMNYNIN
ncbi:hypothetical protein [Priestia megaterium]|uniref:hypothetical protein n=1 Tax=Priestia megaterium TaxID=1404 RepID=UPI001C211940|nr:hypothetical protein [Priestia megaterium]MBU8752325.1 hypothetical protein [Priestia megaterium]